MIEGTGAVAKAESLPVTTVTIEARIFGPVAETRMTMVFSNPHNRALAGDLYFPLPEGATVSGYALDIEGAMVDGVVVEKDKGRQVFEKIVRQGVDPGLVELTKGNNFKTRVFPIPARGKRTVMVRYVTDVVESDGKPLYQLPLRFPNELDSFSIRVEVVKSAAKPEIRGGHLANFEFKQWRDSFVAESASQKVTIKEDISIALPATDSKSALVERGPDGEYYFCFADRVIPPEVRRRAITFGKVGILWDASGSRGAADHAREFRILKEFFQLHKNVEVSLVLFRDIAGTPRTFNVKGGDCAELIAALQEVAYDGGTQMASLGMPKDGPLPDFFLVFTDGLSNFGKEEPADLPRPLYILSDDATANHSFLRYLASKSGGEYLNLKRVTDAHAVETIGRHSYGFISAVVDSGSTDELTPGSGQPVSGRFALAGRLISETAVITLQYGFGGTVSGKTQFKVSRSDAAEGDLFRRFWAQSRVTELQTFPKRNEKEIVALGKRYGLVTPGTSLIVLDNVNQYIEHRIEPPKSMAKWREQYAAAVEKTDMAAKKEDSAKIDRVVALWNKRMEWLNREFKYPKDLKYKEKDGDKEGPEGAAAGANGVVTRTVGQAAAASAPHAPARQAPVAAPAAPRTARETGDLVNAIAGFSGHAAPAGRPTPDGRDPHGSGAGKADASEAAPAVAITPWNPDTPYLKKLKAAEPAARLAVYMAERKELGNSPAFFLDCADFFLKEKDEALGLQILSNVAELELENASLLRILAHKLAQLGRLDLSILLFEEALRLRPEEPQSHRDLALVLARRAEDAASRMTVEGKTRPMVELDACRADFARAIELLYHVVLNHWDRFDEIEVIALMELNRLIPRAKAIGVKDIKVDSRLIAPIALDLRIVMTWHADMTDIDLWVTEPSGEKALYSHPQTTIGGNVSRDFTQGYGPEEYILRKAMTGTYKVEANYYGSSSAQLIGPVTLQLDIFTHYGRPDEQRKSITLRLAADKETVKVGEIEF
jgi:tetratricopeptide (TPR) repeat protein